MNRSFDVSNSQGAIKGDWFLDVVYRIAGKLAGATTPASLPRRSSGVTRHGIARTQFCAACTRTSLFVHALFFNKRGNK